jgi:hypothetical protein
MNTRTIPWHREEFAKVDGHPYVYTREGDTMLIRFPGGGAATPQELKLQGCEVVMPELARGWQS